MCGINGIVGLTSDAAPVDREELLRTRDAMASRGPDGEGVWISTDGRVGLGHRRLAIIDLSDGGRQPMSYDGDRFQIVFNGEIYNYRELREELTRAGVVFRSASDTEVILALYARHGTEMLARLRGMYAFGIWDERERRLLLARDPYGIKPLYYSIANGTVRFASQVKALCAGRAVPSDLDSAGLVGFLLWGSVPEPWTLRRAVRGLPAGHWVEFRAGATAKPRPHEVFGAVPRGEALDTAGILGDSVRSHLVADVPVAVFLSAGLDSSLIAALAARFVSEPLTSLTLRFGDYAGTSRDEAPLAAEVAAALGLRHVDRLVERREFLDLWPAVLAAMDQPSIDGFNTFVVSRVAHEAGFKVVLSGLGGDELFGGYASFRDVPRWRAWAARLRRVPGLTALWPGLAAALRAGKPKLRGMLEYGATLAGAYFLRHALYLPHEIARLIGEERTREGLAQYDPLADAAKYLDGWVGGGEPTVPAAHAWEAVHVMESTQFMRNQLLRDADWASMAHSLEIRVPLVDSRLRREFGGNGFEPARSGSRAELVRRVAPELPPALWARPKSGFSIPVMEWLDDQADPPASPGAASRRLALRVLEGFGVDLPHR